MRKIIIFLSLILALTAIAGNHYESKGKPTQRLRVGLVLGGGGAKGAATVGVLKTIEKSGIPIDYIAGTSIGSIVGGMWACGMRSEQLEELFQSQEWGSLLTDRNDAYKNKIWKKEDGVVYVFGFPVAGKGKKEKKNGRKTIGLVRGEKIVHLLDSLSGNRDSMSFDKLPIPFKCVATDIVSEHEVVLDHGNLVTAMRASMAIPGLFKPVELDSMVLVDGGMCNNLPVDVVRAMGADVVIAVDLTQNKHEDREEKDIWEKLHLHGLAEWILSRPDISKYNANRANADIYINPQLEGFDALSFQPDKIEKMIAIGEQTGKKYRKALRRLKKRVLRGK